MKKSADSILKEENVLAKNSLINIAGQALPLVFAAAAIPFVIKGLGTDRFGILTIVWVIIGYFGLFDMGISRATKKFVADMDARGSDQITPFILTSIGSLIIVGSIISIAIYLISPWVVDDILNISADLKTETIHAFYILSFSIPFALGSVAARGALEARQQFSLVNAIKIPASIINFGSPLVILPFTNRLPPIVTILFLARVATFFSYLYFSIRDDWHISWHDFRMRPWIKKLLGYGSWVMISNFISPLMVYMDRFILGAILTMSAVAYYTTPYEVVSRLLIISGSFMSVLFPAFSIRSLANNRELANLHQKSMRFLLLVMLPIIIFLLISAHSLLQLWLGHVFARESTVVLRLLALGVLINSISMVPYTALEAIGRPDITAKLHMMELPVYLVMIWFFTHHMGINGVALAWVIRITVDGILLMYFSHYLIAFFNINWKKTMFPAFVILTLAAIMFFIFLQLNGLYAPLIYAAVCGVTSFWACWKFMLHAADRNQVHHLLGTLKTKIS